MIFREAVRDRSGCVAEQVGFVLDYKQVESVTLVGLISLGLSVAGAVLWWDGR